VLTVTIPRSERARRRRIEVGGAQEPQSLDGGQEQGTDANERRDG
jgi:hypothetical protein